MTEKGKNLIVRFLSGSVFVATMIAAICLGDAWFGVLFLFFTIMGMREYCDLMNKKEGVDLPQLFVVGCGILVFAISYFVFIQGDEFCLYSLCFVMVSLMMMLELFRRKAQPLMNMSLSLMGILYVAVPFSLMAYVESTEMGAQLLLAFFIIIWASDTGAYIVGMLLGKHKMIERISPKKTWEGFAGGLFFSVLAGVIFSRLSYFPPYTLLSWIGISALIFVFGVAGDLVESLIKRDLGVKDSGKFLPGHGGLLDRFDSALVAAPVLFLVVMMLYIC